MCTLFFSINNLNGGCRLVFSTKNPKGNFNNVSTKDPDFLLYVVRILRG